MLSRNHPDRIQITFDDHRLVANAGLLLPATLAQHLGLPELVQQRLDLGDAPRAGERGGQDADAGRLRLGLPATASTPPDALRAGGTVSVLGCMVKAPSTLGTFLRSFRWGHVRQLDRVSRQLLARAWAAGAGPGDSPLTIDVDSTICETYGLAKEGARPHGYIGARGYHPLLAIAAGTGDVLMSPSARGPGQHRPAAPPTSCVKRWGGCATAGLQHSSRCGPTAASMATLSFPPAGKWMSASPSPSASTKSLRDLIEAIPEEDWTPIPYWMDGAADVAETTYTPFQTKPDAAAGAAHCPAGEADARFPARPLRQIQLSRLHHRPGRGDARTGG